MLNQEKKIAQCLHDLLVLYVLAGDVKEEHNRKVINNNYRTLLLERKAYNHFQEKYQQPVLSKCKSFGFRYSDLLEIIPPPFETNIIQRHEILDDLKVFYKKEFGRHD